VKSKLSILELYLKKYFRAFDIIFQPLVAFAQLRKKNILALSTFFLPSVRPSVNSHERTTRFPLNRFSWNFTYGCVYSDPTCILFFFSKIGQKWQLGYISASAAWLNSSQTDKNFQVKVVDKIKTHFLSNAFSLSSFVYKIIPWNVTARSRPQAFTCVLAWRNNPVTQYFPRLAASLSNY
jgi:hypothetical protein